ncbi:helix-turn-helix transcriptional regulator [bacterium]|nr:helix-turn-helix transcriptional regulator [bacterium]
MIKTESEYQECLKRLKQDDEHIEEQRKALKKAGLKSEEIKRALEPSLSFNEQLKEEVEWYERVKRRDFDILQNLSGLGRLLIALRISNDMSQSDLAKRLKVDVSSVSRDERNEYHGITVERAQKILNAMGEKLSSTVIEKSIDIEDRTLVSA